MESIMESIVNGMTKRARERSIRKSASPTESEENPFEALGKSERRTRFRQSDRQFRTILISETGPKSHRNPSSGRPPRDHAASRRSGGGGRGHSHHGCIHTAVIHGR